MNRPNKMPVINCAMPAFRESSPGKKNTHMPIRINPKLKINEEYLNIKPDMLMIISVSLNITHPII